MAKRLIFTEWLKKNGVDPQAFIKRVRKSLPIDCNGDTSVRNWVALAFSWEQATKDGFVPENMGWLELSRKWRFVVLEHANEYGITSVYYTPKHNAPEFIGNEKLCESVKVFHGRLETVLIYNGKKAVSKCQKGDRYSRLAGLASAAMKLAGMSYEEIAEAFEESKKNAYRPKQKGT